MEEILVLDDNSQNLELIKVILEFEGIAAHCVSSGEEALEKMKERTYSVMITDFNMPGMDGLELSRKGKEIAPQMPIIMNTGAISPKIIRLATEIGISKVFGKPFHAKEMLETIRNVMGKQSESASSTGYAPTRNVGVKIPFDSLNPFVKPRKAGVADLGFS